MKNQKDKGESWKELLKILSKLRIKNYFLKIEGD